jgi:hypothetical protein
MRIILPFVFAFGLVLLGCEAKTIIDPPLPPDSSTLATKQFTTGSTNDHWVYFSFSKADTVSVVSPYSSQDWDVAFYRTGIKINGGTSGPGKGGAIMLTGVNFEDVKEVPANAAFAVDDTLNVLGSAYAIPAGSDEGWYHYTGDPNHWIVAIEDRFFVFRTADEKYAKVKFVSYYSNGLPPSQPLQTDSGFYTFKFVYQSNGSVHFE